MSCALPTPSEQANKVRGMQSSPSPISKEEPKQYVDDSLRQFDSPEAVKEFLLHAYRPASLSTAVPMDAADVGDSSGLEEEEADTQASLEVLNWPDLEDGAISITDSPRLVRTDVPLTRFLPPKDCTLARRCSLEEYVTTLRRSLELSARSASAPAVYGNLVVEDLWRKLPKRPDFANPFADVVDTEGMFR